MARGDFPSSKQDQFNLRFPPGLRDRIKAEAERNGRSMNTEIITRLEESLYLQEIDTSTSPHFSDALNSTVELMRMQALLINELVAKINGKQEVIDERIVNEYLKSVGNAKEAISLGSSIAQSQKQGDDTPE